MDSLFTTDQLSPHARAVIAEIGGALERFVTTGEEHTIFINKMALNQNDREEIHNFLGVGGVKITIENTHEPAEWIESAVSGVWFGVFFDHNGRPVLETVEICTFPQVAATQKEDAIASWEQLRNRLTQE